MVLRDYGGLRMIWDDLAAIAVGMVIGAWPRIWTAVYDWQTRDRRTPEQRAEDKRRLMIQPEDD